MNNRISKLSDDSLINLAIRSFQNIDNAMTRMGEASENPYGYGGALSFGWDMPTASVYFPRLTGRFYALKDACKARGLVSVKYDRSRPKRRGKIIYKRVA